VKTGIDSYCFHRYFGEVYGNQTDPGRRMSYDEFLGRAVDLGVAGVSLETCFFEGADERYFTQLRDTMERGGLECIVAWGHPVGLEGGENVAALADMEQHYATCQILGTNVLRIVGSHYGLRNTPHGPQMKKLMAILRDPVKRAEDAGIKLAMENHFDFTCDEMLEMCRTIDSPCFGMTFDTGNAYRYGDDPVAAAGRLANDIFAIHFKDVTPLPDGNPDDWFYNACTPIGSGVLDVPALVRTLDAAGYDGIWAIEFDYLDPRFGDEESALASSVEYLRTLGG